MLREGRFALLRAAEMSGLTRRVLNGAWRRRRLLILCYHGISQADEHEWNSGLYMAPERFRRRMECLRELDANVLPLGEALERLGAGTLASRSVAITFDDGICDFLRVAHPILREFGFPATLYWTTYYSEYNRPVFDVMCPYLLWKGRARGRLELPGVLPQAVALDEAGRKAAERHLLAHARQAGLSAQDKDALLGALAARLGIDWEDLCTRRILHLVSMEEARQLAAAGVDLQLHTHRHRTPLRRDLFEREIRDNRERIASVTAAPPARHFCYPSGYHRPEFVGWLRACGVDSATTCRPGLASASSDRMLLPRLVDTLGLSMREFRAWVSGVAALLPRRREVFDPEPDAG